MMEHFQRLLAAIAATPDVPVAQLDMLQPAELTQLLEEFNNTVVEFPSVPVHELVQARVVEDPSAVALLFEGRQVSYGELNASANRLARHLRSLGVDREVLVGVCLPRGIDLTVAVLAVLKAGGGYVPLDPEYPVERLEFMLADTGARVVIDPAWLAVHAEAIAACGDTDLGSVSGAGDAAYVIYTSGSTGRPKGVVVEHRSIVRLVWQANYLHVRRGERILQLAPVVFD